jgi:hypothetical protein
VALGVLAGGLGACAEDDQFAAARADIDAEPGFDGEVDFGTFVLEEDDGFDDAFLRTITVRNVGTGSLQIFSLELVGDDAGEFFITDAPVVLGPGAEETIFIRFQPTFHHPVQAELVLTSNDPDEREVRWTLVGDARDPCRLSMSPASLKFELGEMRQVEVRTLTQSSCTINFLDTDETLFQIQNSDVEVPVTIEPGEPLVLDILHDYFQPLLLPGEPTRQLRATAQHGQREEINLTGEAPIFGCIRVAPLGDILFGRTPVGTPIRRNVTITNDCDQPVLIRGLTIGSGFEFFRVVDEDLADGFDLPAFESVEFQVEFNALLRGNANGVLVVLTGDTRNPQFRRDLTGTALPPQVDVFPAELDFGTVTFRNPVGVPARSECSSPSREVNLFTVGQAPVRIDGIEVDASSDDLFVVTSVAVDDEPVLDPSQPFDVPGGLSMKVTVRFFPTRVDPALHTGTLRIFHNAQGGESVVDLVGRAAPDVPVADSFEQPEGPKVDILWVIDNSCSMADEQQRLVENLSTFIDFADEQEADYQMGITVTDGFSTDSGRLERCFPHPAIISGDYPQRNEAFECTFLVGTDGSGIEAGTDAAKRALERAQQDEPNINTGLLREDADLAIVVVSDEDDQSRNLSANEVFFETVKGPGRASRTKVHAIAGPTTEPCGDGTGFFNAAPAFRYQAMTENTNGLFFNICVGDWSPIFDQLGLDTFQAFDTFFLSQPAEPSSIRVFVDGLQIPNDPNQGYTYRFQENAIRFEGDAVPGPGASIEVRYSNQCTP